MYVHSYICIYVHMCLRMYLYTYSFIGAALALILFHIRMNLLCITCHFFIIIALCCRSRCCCSCCSCCCGSCCHCDFLWLIRIQIPAYTHRSGCRCRCRSYSCLSRCYYYYYYIILHQLDSIHCCVFARRTNISIICLLLSQLLKGLIS